MSPLDTGLEGGTIFEFAWSSDDPISGNIAPLQYSRVDIDYGGDELGEGIILKSAPAISKESGEEVEGTWILSISVGPPHSRPLAEAATAGVQLAIRVHG